MNISPTSPRSVALHSGNWNIKSNNSNPYTVSHSIEAPSYESSPYSECRSLEFPSDATSPSSVRRPANLSSNSCTPRSVRRAPRASDFVKTSLVSKTISPSSSSKTHSSSSLQTVYPTKLSATNSTKSSSSSNTGPTLTAASTASFSDVNLPTPASSFSLPLTPDVHMDGVSFGLFGRPMESDTKFGCPLTSDTQLERLMTSDTQLGRYPNLDTPLGRYPNSETKLRHPLTLDIKNILSNEPIPRQTEIFQADRPQSLPRTKLGKQQQTQQQQQQTGNERCFGVVSDGFSPSVVVLDTKLQNIAQVLSPMSEIGRGIVPTMGAIALSMTSPPPHGSKISHDQARIISSSPNFPDKQPSLSNTNPTSPTHQPTSPTCQYDYKTSLQPLCDQYPEEAHPSRHSQLIVDHPHEVFSRQHPITTLQSTDFTSNEHFLAERLASMKDETSDVIETPFTYNPSLFPTSCQRGLHDNPDSFLKFYPRFHDNRDSRFHDNLDSRFPDNLDSRIYDNYDGQPDSFPTSYSDGHSQQTDRLNKYSKLDRGNLQYMNAGTTKMHLLNSSSAKALSNEEVLSKAASLIPSNTLGSKSFSANSPSALHQSESNLPVSKSSNSPVGANGAILMASSSVPSPSPIDERRFAWRSAR